MKADQQAHHAKRLPKLGIFLLLLWILLLAAADYIYLTYLQPSRLGHSVSQALEHYLAIPAQIGRVDFSFFPEPAIVIRGFSLHSDEDPQLQVWVDKIRAELNWRSLLRLRPVIDTLNIERPLVYATVHTAPSSASQGQELDWTGLLGDLVFSDSLPELPDLLAGLNFSLSSGQLRLLLPERELDLLANDFYASLRLPGLLNGQFTFSADQATLYGAAFPNLYVDMLQIKAESLQDLEQGLLTADLDLRGRLQVLQSLAETSNPDINPVYDYFPLPEPAQLVVSLHINALPASKSLDLDGTLDSAFSLNMNGEIVPFRLTVPFSAASLDFIHLDNLTALLGDDNARLTGQLSGLASGNPVLSGRLITSRFSLTRWFGFARSLSAGLQNVLNYTSGFADFVLTGNSVLAPRLELQHGDFIVQGSAGCPDFRNPAINLEGHIIDANLNILFPEVSGQGASYPVLPPPAFPVNRTGVRRLAFNLHATADFARIRNLDAQNLDCLIMPLPQELQESSDEDWPVSLGSYLIMSAESFYDGSLSATAVLRDPFVIHAELNGVDLEDPVLLLSGYNAFGGKIDAAVDAGFSGGGPGQILASLEASVQARIQNGYIGSTNDTKTPFNELNLKATAADTANPEEVDWALPPSTDLRGNWDIRLDMPEALLHVVANNASLTLTTNNFMPLTMPAQNATLDITLRNRLTGWGSDLQVSGRGRLGFDLQANTLSLLDFSGNSGGFDLTATLRVANLTGNMEVSGPVSIRTNTLRESAANFNLNLPTPRNPDYMRSLILDANLNYRRRGFTLSELVATLDQSFMQGSLSANFGERTQYTANLQIGSLDLDGYLPPTSEETAPEAPIDLSVLRSVDVEGNLAITQLRLFAIPLRSVSIPFSLNQGVLQIPTMSALFPEAGNLSAFMTGTIQPLGTAAPHASFRLNSFVNDLNLLALSEARSQETLLAGTLNLVADLNTTFNTNKDLYRNLNGGLSLEVTDGYMVSRTDEARYQAELSAQNTSPRNTQTEVVNPRTNFRTLSASASIENGLLRTDNFSMRNPGLNIRGGGSIYLPDMSLDANVTATLLGVPEMPVHIGGTLRNPDLSYNVPGAVAGTIGNLLFGILTAPFRLFIPR